LRAAGVLLVLLGTTAGDESGDEMRRLVARLRSDRIEEREAAALRIREAGPAVLPELRRAEQDPDPEISQRAARLARLVDAARILGARVFRKMPEAEALLASPVDHDWTEVFFAAAAMPGITRASLDLLAPRAMAGALAIMEDPDDPGGRLRRRRFPQADPDDVRRRAAALVAEWKLRSALPQLLRWPSHAAPTPRECAILALGPLKELEAQPQLLRLLHDPDPRCRAA